MAAKKPASKPTTTSKHDPNVLQVTRGLEGIDEPMDNSEISARLATRSYMTAHAHRAYCGFDKEVVAVTDIDAELRANGDAVVAGDLGRVERMLIGQAITLDTIFANLAERASRQTFLKNTETYLRLAMKAQAQCRATAEALALLKNPQPYIRQANIANGPQQVNNAYASASAHNPIPASASVNTLENNQSPVLPTQYAQEVRACGDISSFQPNKLLKDTNG